VYIIGEYDVGNDGSEDKEEEEEEDDAIFIFLIGGGGCFWQHVVWCAIWVDFLSKIILW